MTILNERGHTPEQADIVARAQTGHRASMNAYYRHRSLLIDAAWIVAAVLVVLAVVGKW
jgi:hypothetical protein